MHSQQSIPALTGLRCIAVFSIVYAHYTVSLRYTLFGVVWQTAIIGMPLFFALSGFIIHYVYARLFSREWRPAAREFSLARFSRLYPLFILLFAYFFCFSSLGPAFMEPAHWPVLLSYLTLTYSWWYTVIDGKALIQFNYGWSWSVATEWFFYVVYALLFYRIARIRSPRLCLSLLAGFCVLSYALLYGIFSTGDQWEGYVLASHPGFIARAQDFSNSFYRWVVYTSPYVQILAFTGGCLTSQLYLLIKDREDACRKARPRLLAWAGMLWILLCAFAVSEALPQSLQQHVPPFFIFLSYNFLLVPACYMLIMACALGGNGLSSALSRRVPEFLGEISYSVYLVHLMIPLFVELKAEHATRWIVTCTALAIVAAAGLYFMVEVPARRWLRKVLA